MPVPNLKRICQCIIIAIITGSCATTPDLDQVHRLQQLDNFATDYGENLNAFDFVFVEGQTKCAGCSEIWPKRLTDDPILKSDVLIIGNDSGIANHFGMRNATLIAIPYDSIEYYFPYIGNYFLFFRSEGEFAGYVELGAKDFPLPWSDQQKK